MKSLSSREHRAALKGRDRFRDAVVALVEEHDLDAIAHPESTFPAARVGGSQSAFDCGSAAYGGLPAMVIPTAAGGCVIT